MVQKAGKPTISDQVDDLQVRDVPAVKADTAAIIINLTSAVGVPPNAKSLHDILHKDANYTYDNTSDSLEALADTLATAGALILGNLPTKIVTFVAYIVTAGQTAYLGSSESIGRHDLVEKGVDTGIVGYTWWTIPLAMTLKAVGVSLSVAPGAGENLAYTIRKNEVNTASTVTISDAAKTGSNATDVSFAAGDELTVQVISSGGAATTAMVATLYFVKE